MKYLTEFYVKLPWVQRQALDLLFRVSLCLLIVLTFRAMIDIIGYVGMSMFLGAILVGVMWFLLNILRLYNVDKVKLREFDVKLQQAQNAQAGTGQQPTGRESYTAGGNRPRNVQQGNPK